MVRNFETGFRRLLCYMFATIMDLMMRLAFFIYINFLIFDAFLSIMTLAPFLYIAITYALFKCFNIQLPDNTVGRLKMVGIPLLTTLPVHSANPSGHRMICKLSGIVFISMVIGVVYFYFNGYLIHHLDRSQVMFPAAAIVHFFRAFNYFFGCLFLLSGIDTYCHNSICRIDNLDKAS